MPKSAQTTLILLLLLTGVLLAVPGLFLAAPGEVPGQAVSGSVSEDVEAPNVTGMAVQGISVDLEYFRGDKNVLLVFYRMYN